MHNISTLFCVIVAQTEHKLLKFMSASETYTHILQEICNSIQKSKKNEIEYLNSLSIHTTIPPHAHRQSSPIVVLHLRPSCSSLFTLTVYHLILLVLLSRLISSFYCHSPLHSPVPIPVPSNTSSFVTAYSYSAVNILPLFIYFQLNDPSINFAIFLFTGYFNLYMATMNTSNCLVFWTWTEIGKSLAGQCAAKSKPRLIDLLTPTPCQ
jgi:hypothetical protein